ncbi:MAG TPA: SGNH/GDSL hydrolase family protein [Myxococcales bacterium]|nr:SGNH/GDSL hydrolase family protein [Myxococcales bacterium]
MRLLLSLAIALGAAPPARYVALGDSFTIGTGGPPERSFPARLAKLWGGTTLENLGVNGYSTEQVIEEELPELARFRPSVVTLAIGANDIVRGDDADGYRANVRRILGAVLAAGVRPDRIFTLPQPDWSLSPTAALFGDAEALGRRIRLYNRILAEESARAGARFVDLFPLMESEAKAGEVADDGLHPSAAAYAAWADAIARAVRP